MSTTSIWLAVLATLCCVCFVESANAEPDAEAKRLMRHRDAERYELSQGPRGLKAGGARVHVAAPSSHVRKVVSDFRNYARFIDQFEKAKVVGRHGAQTDVYLRVPILEGAAKIWAVVRFDPIRSENGEEILEGHLVKGNVKRLDARWRIKKIDDDDTQLHLELLVVPDLLVPGSIVTKESKYAADVSVMGSRDRAEAEYSKRKGGR